MNKPVYLGLVILEISKLVMYEFWYDYVKARYGEKTVLHGQRKLYSTQESRRHLHKHCKIC